MKTALKPLSDNSEKLQEFVLELQQKIADKDTRITQLKQDYQYLLEQFRLAQQASLEKVVRSHSTS